MDRQLANSIASRATIFAVVMTAVWLALPGGGTGQLKKMSAAMQNARSWRVDVTVDEPTKKIQSTVEVYCPSRFHMVNSTVIEEGGGRIEDSSENYWIEGTSYSKKGGRWVINQEMREHTTACTYGPRGGDALLERLDPILTVGKIRKGAKRYVGDQSCRDWIASVSAPEGWRDEFGVCIGEGDLPLEVFTPDRRMVETYSNWNTPIRIEAPVSLSGAPGATTNPN